jgi:sodium/hydrogen antiporter
MRFLGWMSLCGGLLLLMALSSAYLRRLPVSTSAIYLGVGLAIGPLGLAGCASTSATRPPGLSA